MAYDDDDDAITTTNKKVTYSDDDDDVVDDDKDKTTATTSSSNDDPTSSMYSDGVSDAIGGIPVGGGAMGELGLADELKKNATADDEDSKPFEPFYRPIPPISFYRSMPRFGHEDNIAKLVSQEDGASTDYIMGLIFVSSLAATIFFIWSCLILLWKCMGERKVGFLSGAPFLAMNEKGLPSSRPKIVRSIMVLSCVGVIVFNILFVAFGVNHLQELSYSLKSSTQEINYIVKESTAITSSLVSGGDEIQLLSNKVTNDLKDFCPDFDFEATEALFSPKKVENDLKEIEYFLSPVRDLDSYLTSFHRKLNETEETLETYENASWIPACFVLPFVVCASLFLVGTLLAWMEVSTDGFMKVQTYALLPVFVILVMMSWIVAALFGVGAVLNSDTCLGGESESPVGTVKAIMDEMAFKPNDLLYKTVLYYAKGCVAADPYTDIYEGQEELNQAIKTVGTFLGSLTFLEDRCKIGTLRPILKSLRKSLSTILFGSTRALALLTCNRIYDVYEKVIHKTLCNDSITAISWVFGSLLSISFFGMFVITFRASWLDVNEGYDDEEDQEEFEDEAEGSQRSEYASLRKEAEGSQRSGYESLRKSSQENAMDNVGAVRLYDG